MAPASLICESVETLVAHAEVLVIGNVSDEAARVLAAAGPHHVVVDLTRGAVRRLPRSGSESVLPFQTPEVTASGTGSPSR